MKNILITGANKGIGHEVAKQLGERGFHVFLAARNPAAGRVAERFLAAGGAQVTFVEMDVADADSVAAAVIEVSKTAEYLDVLINNAAIAVTGDSAILGDDPDVLRTTFETNTLGPLRVSQAFLPLLRKSLAPRIINVSSGASQLSEDALGWSPAYCVSKTALNGLTSQMAHELPEFAVNSVSPGWVRTDMGGSAAPLSVAEGADSIVWLAAEAPQGLTGIFIRDRVEIPW